MKKPKAILFDFDGTLFDTESVWRRECLATYHELGVPMTETLLSETSGMHMTVSLPYWFARFSWSDTRSFEEIAASMARRAIAALEDHGAPMRDGAKELLALSGEVCAVHAICSGSPENLIRSVLAQAGMEQQFSLIRSCDADGKHKPDPAVYVSAARLLGCSQQMCTAIEDSVAGVASACDAGMHCVAVPDARYISADRVARAAHVAFSLRDVTAEMLCIPS
jgi:mannitol-1-/sugar-/sorbitol-6-/2-deoxyglucose-6-phosphatase